MPTGIDKAMAQDMKMSVQGQTLHIVSDRNATLNLYYVDGRICRICKVHVGENSIEGLRPGVYMLNNNKLIVR